MCVVHVSVVFHPIWRRRRDRDLRKHYQSHPYLSLISESDFPVHLTRFKEPATGDQRNPLCARYKLYMTLEVYDGGEGTCIKVVILCGLIGKPTHHNANDYT
jgi:hypothetical protein